MIPWHEEQKHADMYVYVTLSKTLNSHVTTSLIVYNKLINTIAQYNAKYLKENFIVGCCKIHFVVLVIYLPVPISNFLYRSLIFIFFSRLVHCLWLDAL